MNAREQRPAVFLDRDGTVLDELDYLGDPRDVHILPGAAAAVARLNAAGIPVVLVTNQSGIARGYFTEETLARVHARLTTSLAEEGAHFEGILHCPHHPEIGEPPWRTDCKCRKPKPGLILQAADRWGLEPTASAVVGDAARDLEAGRRAGVPHRILVLTGKGRATRRSLDADAASTLATHVALDLGAAVDRILGELHLRPG